MSKPMPDALADVLQDLALLDLHPRTRALVADFALALAAKLTAAQAKYGYTDGWASSDWLDQCRLELRRHVEKGDPLDVAAYSAFLWHHRASTCFKEGAQPRYDLAALRACAQAACLMARHDPMTREEPFDRDLLECESAQRYVDSHGAPRHRILIRGADPACAHLIALVRNALRDHGFFDLDIELAW